MRDYGILHELNGRYSLKFKRFFPVSQEEVFSNVTSPEHFMQWYPFTTGEMEVKLGGQIAFDEVKGQRTQQQLQNWKSHICLVSVKLMI